MSEYTQGFCQDGAAILRDGKPMTIEEVLEGLRYADALAAHCHRYRQAVFHFSRSRGDINPLLLLMTEEPTTSLARRDVHPDDQAVERFADAMKAKLAAARAKGRGGWDDPGQCSAEFLADLLVGHVGKRNTGNLEDIANLAMMLHQRGERPEVVAQALARLKAEWQAEALASLRADWQAKGVLGPQESLMLMNREQELRQAQEES